MPVYTYQCQSCAGYFERLLLEKDRYTQKGCVHCGKQNVKLIPSKLGYRRDRTVNP